MKGIQFTAEEKQLLIEVLLFSSVTDVCAEWTSAQNEKLLDLAKKINDPNIKLNNVYLLEDGLGGYADPALLERVMAEFPNLPRVNIIHDK